MSNFKIKIIGDEPDLIASLKEAVKKYRKKKEDERRKLDNKQQQKGLKNAI